MWRMIKKLMDLFYNQQKATEENLLERALIVFGIVVIILAILFAYSISLKRAVKKRTTELESEIIQRKKQEAGLEKMSRELQVSNNELSAICLPRFSQLKGPVTNLNLDKHGERLFNPYQRFQPTIEGKDLGLYLIKTQVEKMAGKISIESNVNEGTTFSIYFRQNP